MAKIKPRGRPTGEKEIATYNLKRSLFRSDTGLVCIGIHVWWDVLSDCKFLPARRIRGKSSSCPDEDDFFLTEGTTADRILSHCLPGKSHLLLIFSMTTDSGGPSLIKLSLSYPSRHDRMRRGLCWREGMGNQVSLCLFERGHTYFCIHRPYNIATEYGHVSDLIFLWTSTAFVLSCFWVTVVDGIFTYLFDIF